MTGAFTSSMRSLAADNSRSWLLWLFSAAILLSLWVAWFLTARVSLYEVSEAARLEVNTTAHPITASIQARVVATYMVLGQDVRMGDILLELEAQSERLRLEEQKAQVATLSNQLSALRDEIRAEETSRSQQLQTSLLTISESRQRSEEAEAGARLSQEEAERLSSLHAKGVLSEISMLRSRVDAQKSRAGADALRLAVSRLESELKNRESDSQVRIERLNRDTAYLEGQISGSATTVKRLEFDIEQRRIRAPIAGRLGETAQLQVGAVVNVGDRIGAIVPQGDLKAIAYFRPSALGRIQPGQDGQLHLDGFDWHCASYRRKCRR